MSNAKLPAPNDSDVCKCGYTYEEHVLGETNRKTTLACDNFRLKAGAEATGKLEQQLYTEDELQEAWEAGASYASDYEHGYRGKDYKTFKKQLDEYRNSLIRKHNG